MSSKPVDEEKSRQVLRLSPEGILVGGAALSYWTLRFGLSPPDALCAGVSYDIDFVGLQSHAKSLARRLQDSVSNPVKIYLAELDRATHNSAKIVVKDFLGPGADLEIDYLSYLHQFSPVDSERMAKRAIKIDVDGGFLWVTHPLDLLVSRVKNIEGLPSKRDNVGFAQCRLSISVLFEWISRFCRESKEMQRKVFPLIEQIIQLAGSVPGLHVFATQGIDVLDAIPLDLIISVDFHEKRWPGALSYLQEKRAKFALRLRE